MRCAHGSRSAIGPRATRLNCTWLDSTGAPERGLGALPAATAGSCETPTSSTRPTSRSARMPRIVVASPISGLRLVHLVEVDRAHPEPVRAGHAALLHDRRGGQHREHLRRDDHVVRAARLPQRLAEDALAAAEAVDLRRVEHGDPQRAGPRDDLARRVLVVLAPVAPLAGAELPGAQPDHRVPLAGGEVQVAHAVSLTRRERLRRAAGGGAGRAPPAPARPPPPRGRTRGSGR